ncbi:MAG: hypothetical protein ACPGWR_04780 [Ardenticatenaceae bacterium]
MISDFIFIPEVPKDKLPILFVDSEPEKGRDLEPDLNHPKYYFVKVKSCVEAFRCLLQQDFALILLRIEQGVNEALDLLQIYAGLQDIPVRQVC